MHRTSAIRLLGYDRSRPNADFGMIHPDFPIFGGEDLDGRSPNGVLAGYVAEPSGAATQRRTEGSHGDSSPPG